MARYNTILISSVYLTSTGLVSGNPCRTSVDGLAPYKLTKTGSVHIALDGSPFVQMENVKGTVIGVTIDTVSATVFGSVVTAIQTAITNNTTLRLYVSGDTGTFDFDVVPNLPEAVNFTGEFRNTYLKQVTFNFVVSGLRNVLVVPTGRYEITGKAITLTYSGA